MKQYPSITNHISPSIDVIVFDKLDGSNVRAEWTRKHKQFVKFGRRNGLLDDSTQIIHRSIELMRSKYEKDLSEIFIRAGFQKVVCFFEFFGPNSFAGLHNADDVHDVVLFDVSPHKHGILGPREFLSLCGHLDIPNVLHNGKINDNIINDVREGTFDGMTFEGIVCKPKKMTHNSQMFKVKNKAWLEKLKERCDNDEEFRRLA